MEHFGATGHCRVVLHYLDATRRRHGHVYHLLVAEAVSFSGWHCKNLIGANRGTIRDECR